MIITLKSEVGWKCIIFRLDRGGRIALVLDIQMVAKPAQVELERVSVIGEGSEGYEFWWSIFETLIDYDDFKRFCIDEISDSR